MLTLCLSRVQRLLEFYNAGPRDCGAQSDPSPFRNDQAVQHAFADCPGLTGRARAWCAVLLSLALIVYGLGFSPNWRVGMDQGFYASIARSIATGQGYTFSGKTQWSVPPATPLYLAAAYRLGRFFQPDISFLEAVVYLNAFMLIAGLAGLVTAFLLIREMVPAAGPLAGPSSLPATGSGRATVLSPVAVVITAMALLTFSGRYYRLCLETMTDVPYSLVSWAAMFFALRSLRSMETLPDGRLPGRANLAALSFFLALASFVRVASLVLIANVGAFLLLNAFHVKPRRSVLARLAVLAPGLVVSAAMLLAIWLGRDEETFNYLSGEQGTYDYLSAEQILRTWIVQWPSNLLEVPARLFGVLFGMGSRAAPGLVVFGVVAIGAASWWRRGRRLAVSYAVSSVVMTCAMTAPQTRYFVPLLPFIFLFAIDGVLTAGGWVDAALSRVAPGARLAARARALFAPAAAGALALVLLAGSSQIGSVIALNFGGDFYRRYQKGEYSDYFALARDLAANPPPGAVMAREHRVIFALSGVAVCPPCKSEVPGSSDLSDIAAYVRDRSVAAIVVNPRHAESARDFADFIGQGPFRWQPAGRYGTLEVYSRLP